MRQSFISFVVLLSVLATGMSSCKKSKDHYVPYISFSAFLRGPQFSNDSIVGCKDTVTFKLDSVTNKYVADTIAVGDTVLFLVGYGSRGNDLVSARLSADTTALRFIYTVSDEVRDVLKAESKPEEGLLYFNAGYNFVIIPTVYIARKSGSYDMVFTVTSDSDYSPVSLTVVQPVSE